MAATAYVTAAGVAEVVGDCHLAAAAPAPAGSTPAWDAATVQRAIDAVAEEVDGRLRNAYDVPLDDVPVYLSRAVARLVHAELVDSGTTTDLIESRAAAARKLIDRIARGEIRIGADDVDGDGRTNTRTRQGRPIIHLPPGRRRHDWRGVV